MIEMKKRNSENDQEYERNYNAPDYRRHYGASLPFWFVDGEPLMTLGPHCKKLNKLIATKNKK
jgi:hypothetical protein